MREEEAAPPSGVDTGGSGTTNKHHFSSMGRELNIPDVSGALEGGTVTLWQIPESLPFRVNPPVEATVKLLRGDPKTGDAQYEVKLMFSSSGMADVQSKFLYPRNGEEDATVYEDPIEDETIMMTQEELSNAMVKPIEQGGGMGMGMGMGMGGDPMGGGMAPPMGGGMAPPMGAPGGI